MVLHISEQLIKKRFIEPAFYEFLSYIMMAYREGKHIIIISPISLKSLLNDTKIDNATLSSIKDYNAHNKGSMDLLKSFNVIIKIIPTSIKEKRYSKIFDKTEIRKIHLTKFLDSSTIQNTRLLGENTNDAKACTMIAEYYLRKKSLNYFRVSCNEEMGGGSTTVTQYKHIFEKNEQFCLCILDSDKKHPSETYGDTARLLKKFHFEEYQVNPNLKCQYFILNKLEIENYIPEGFFVEFYEADIENLKYNFGKINFLRSVNANCTDFLDLKKGLKSFASEINESRNYF